MPHPSSAANASVLNQKRRIAPQAETTPEESRDLGFGAKVLQESHTRLLNRDGSFNARRHGIPWVRSWSLFHWLLTISWRRFYLVIVCFYTIVNLIFASLYFLLGPEALMGEIAATETERFWESFFFSVQTLTTVGYGRISPVGIVANAVASVDLLVGLLSFAIITGLLFARFSQPAVRIRFSKVGLIAPFKNGYAFMFRIVNERNSQLVDLRATVAFTRVVTDASGVMTRRFFSLNLDRDRVMFFPLHWTVVHPITAESPLADLSEEDFRSSKGEFVVALQGTDESTGQTVHARSSFGASEVIFYAKFSDLLGRDQDGYLSVDIGKLDQFQPLAGID